MFRIRSWSRCALAVIAGSLALGASWSSARGDLAPNFPPYKSKAGAPIAGIKVGLASNAAGAYVWDTDLAAWTNPLMVNRVQTSFAFGQCFGGGMIENLRANAAAAGSNFSATSASQWNEFATYRGAAGQTADWVDTYIAGSWGLLAPRHDTTASDAWRNDPYGSAGNNLGWERAQWMDNGTGAANKLNDFGRDNRYAILWSGSPNAIDWNQLEVAYSLLTLPIIGYNYDPSKVFILAGMGVGDAGLPPALAGVPNLLPATPMLLQATLAGMAMLGAADQLLFMANDHGVINILGKSYEQPKWSEDEPPNWDPEWGNIPSSWLPTPGTGILLALAGMLGARRRRA